MTPNMVVADAEQAPPDEIKIDHRLSLGIELEFFIVFPPGAFGNAECPPLEQAIIAVSDALRRHRVPVADARANLACATDRDYKAWLVDTDEHKLTAAEAAQLPRGLLTAPIELVSRAFQHRKRVFPDEVRRAVAALRSLEGPRCAVFTTAACGLHVHVGLGVAPRKSDTWRLPDVKNLLAFLLACEPALDRLHTARRVGHDARSFCRPLSALFAERERQGRCAPARSNGIYAWLREIEGVADAEGLLGLFEPFRGGGGGGVAEWLEDPGAHHMAYNVENMQFRAPTAEKNTVEFRQHAGTLDAAAAVAWMELVATVVTFFVRYGESAALARALARCDLRAVDVDIADLFDVVGLRADVARHYLDRLAMDDNACFQLARARAERCRGTPLFAFVRDVEMAEMKDARPRAVQGAIADKFARGLYGYRRDVDVEVCVGNVVEPDAAGGRGNLGS